jgi:hypothetical protein
VWIGAIRADCRSSLTQSRRLAGQGTTRCAGGTQCLLRVGSGCAGHVRRQSASPSIAGVVLRCRELAVRATALNRFAIARGGRGAHEQG